MLAELAMTFGMHCICGPTGPWAFKQAEYRNTQKTQLGPCALHLLFVSRSQVLVSYLVECGKARMLYYEQSDGTRVGTSKQAED